MNIFLYWGFGVFLYFKIAISIVDFGYSAELTVLSSLLISITFCIILISTTRAYAVKLARYNTRKILYNIPANKNTSLEIIKLTIFSYITSSIIFLAIARLIVFEFSKRLNGKIRGDEEIILTIILLLPLLLHYAMIITAANLNQKNLPIK